MQNTGGSVTSRLASLQVTLRPPVIDADPVNRTALVGDSVAFECHATGTNVSCRWQRGGADIVDAAASTLTVSVSQADDGATYRCVATNSGGSVTSAAATLDVVACIAARFTPQDASCGSGACADTGRTSCNGGVILDSCVPGTTSLPTCSDSQVISCVNGQDHAAECSDSDACNGAESCSAGHCTNSPPPVVDDNDACTADSCDPAQGVRHVALSQGTNCGSGKQCDAGGSCIAITPPVVTQAPADATVNLGGTASFSVRTTGGNLSYQWLRMGEELAGATSATYTRNGIRTDDHGTQFSVRVSNTAGSIVSAPATLSVVDSVGPVVSVDGDNARETTSDSIVLTGSVRDAGVGVASLDVRSSRYGTQLFGATVTGERFTVEVPLALGANALTFIARDAANNLTQTNVSVTSSAAALPRLTITSPVDGSRTDSDNVTVSGTVRSSLAPTQIRLLLGSQVTFPTGSGGEYAFSFPNVRLATGPNLISVRAETVYGSVIAQTVVERRSADTQTTNPPPKLSVVAKSSDVYASGTAVQVSGTATDERCITSVTANGQTATLTGQGTSVTFDASLPFALQTDSIAIHVVATDCDGGEATLDYTVRRDTVAPVLTVQNLTLSPASNPATTTPYPVSGTISELNLAGFSADEQSIGVLPAGDGSYTFNMDVPLVRGQTRALKLEAWDFAGNRAVVAVNITLDAQLDLQVVSPVDGAKFMVSGTSQALEVVARAPGLASGDRVVAVVDGGGPVSLALSESVARGDVSLGEGSHSITVRVESSAGVVLASKAVKVMVTDEDSIPLALVSTNPSNAATGVEGNAPIVFSLSKPVIDPNKLTVRVLETVHAESYQAPQGGEGLGSVSEAQLVRIDRDRQLVLGNLTILPGDGNAIFNPVREFAQSALVAFEVIYDGQTIGKAAFGVRSAPTLLSGTVLDQRGALVAGVEVTIKELNRTVVTDLEGNFSFGYGEPAANDLASGNFTLIVNPGAKSVSYGTTTRRLTVAPQRLNRVGVIPLLRLSDRVPYRQVATGQSQAVLDGGDLTIDFSNAQLAFPGGEAEGGVHVQAVLMAHSGVLGAPQGSTTWVYRIHPSGVQVSGTTPLVMALPKRGGSHAYLDEVGERVLLLGLDATAGRLVPVGVAKVDRGSFRISSEGTVALRSLDAIGYAFVSDAAQPTLDAYARGELTLTQLTVALSRVQEVRTP